MQTNMVQRLLCGRHRCVMYDRRPLPGTRDPSVHRHYPFSHWYREPHCHPLAAERLVSPVAEPYVVTASGLPVLFDIPCRRHRPPPPPRRGESDHRPLSPDSYQPSPSPSMVGLRIVTFGAASASTHVNGTEETPINTHFGGIAFPLNSYNMMVERVTWRSGLQERPTTDWRLPS